MIKKLGFTPVKYEKINSTMLMTEWIMLYNKFKEESEYDIDGIVVQSNVEYDRNTSGNPSYMFAFKVNSDDAIHPTKVLDI